MNGLLTRISDITTRCISKSICEAMAFPELIAVLRPSSEAESRSAFLTPFGIPDRTMLEEFGVKKTETGRTGCRVPRLSLSVHCCEPHLECAAHLMETSFDYCVSDALANGSVEKAVLISPQPEKLGISGETYPAGQPEDLIISKRELVCALSAYECNLYDSIVIRISSDYLPTFPGSTEIREWPFLSQECSEYIRSRFQHYRTNAPSVEKSDSGGEMWNHRILFNLPAGDFSSRDYDEKRTIGELFFIPDRVPDGVYQLMCPFLEMKADCALVVPLLYSLS